MENGYLNLFLSQVAFLFLNSFRSSLVSHQVPYEVFNKRYRNAQRVLDVEARQVGSAAGELDAATRKQSVTTGEIDTLLGGMVR